MNTAAVSTPNKAKAFLKKWMSMGGIALRVIVFSLLSYVKFVAQY